MALNLSPVLNLEPSDKSGAAGKASTKPVEAPKANGEASTPVEATSKPVEAPKANGVDAFAISDNIPMPETVRGQRQSKYPWEKLNVGQSFFVPGAKAGTFYTLAAGMKKRTGKTFKAKAMTENGTDGVRVWRTV